MEYQLELKQIVDFPRCRIYRNFIQTLLNDSTPCKTRGPQAKADVRHTYWTKPEREKRDKPRSVSDTPPRSLRAVSIPPAMIEAAAAVGFRSIHDGLIGRHCDFIDCNAESKCARRDGQPLDAAQENGLIIELGYSRTVAF